MSGWIRLDEAISIVATKLGRENALQRLEHRIWEAQVSTKTRLVELWGDGGRSQPASPEDRILFTRLAIKGLAQAKRKKSGFKVEHADFAAGDITVVAGDTLVCVFGLRLLEEDVRWAFDVAGADVRSRLLTNAEVEEWIGSCKTENSKEAYRLLRAERGKASPKREDFMQAWRRVKGKRPPGRPRKSPT